MDAQNLHKDPLVEVRPVWHQTWWSILQTKEYTYADSIIKNGKKQPRKTERTKELDGANKLAKLDQVVRLIRTENIYLDIHSWYYP